jgi:two-component system chemotaxis response regulator CheB
MGFRPPFDIVAIAGSQGGLPACRQLLSALPPEFPVPLALVLHRRSDSRLAEVLRLRLPRPVWDAEPGAALRPGAVHVLPHDASLTIGPGGAFKPADPTPKPADALFASCARAFGPRALAVVLTGRLDDGAVGAATVKAYGGRVLVQDRETSEAFGMPAAAIAAGAADFVLPLERIASAVVALAMVPGAADFFRVRRSHLALPAA